MKKMNFKLISITFLNLIIFVNEFVCKSLLNFQTLESNYHSQNKSKLILISFDGFRWDYLENHTLPNLNKYFVQNGVKATNGIKNAFTTVTFPNHFSIATGLYPESHGIVANVMYDSKLNDTFYDFGSKDNSSVWFGQSNQTIPIWILNELKNVSKSGIIGGFPGANVPFLNRTVSYSQDYLNKLDWHTKVDNLLDLFLVDNLEDRINFGVLYFPEPDETGHTYGPYSQELNDVLLKCDELVGYLMQRLLDLKLFDSMNIIITADHGMDTASFNKSIDLSDYVDINKFNSFGGLTQINIFPKNPNETDEIYNALKKVPKYNVYKHNEVPERFNYKNNVRIGSLIMFGDVGYEIFRTNRSKYDWNNWKGDHGGDNNFSSMHPVFVARGPAFKKNYQTPTNKTINIVDIYDLMCFILDLEPLTATNGTFKNVECLIDESYLLKKEIDFYLENYQLNSSYNTRLHRLKILLVKLNSINDNLFNLVRCLFRKLINYVYVFSLFFILFGFILIVMRKKSCHYNQSYPLINYRLLKPRKDALESSKYFAITKT